MWNRIPDEIRDRILQFPLAKPDLSPQELAARFVTAWNTEPQDVDELIAAASGLTSRA